MAYSWTITSAAALNTCVSSAGRFDRSNKIWSAAVTLDVTDDPGVVREMALAGCTGVFIGFRDARRREPRPGAKAHPQEPRITRGGSEFLHDYGIQVNGSFVVGFDGDTKNTFTELADWIEANRLECATFHILTPYPGTPLFRQLESQGRLLHRDWEQYDTAHVVFQPAQMTPEELLLGYDWLYRRLFSHASIWRRRPTDLGSLPAYLAGCYLYKRSNRLWHWLIKRRLVRRVWRPLISLTLRRHLAFRTRLMVQEAMASRDAVVPAEGTLIPAGV